jgi:hypothetical protein
MNKKEEGDSRDLDLKDLDLIKKEAYASYLIIMIFF